MRKVTMAIKFEGMDWAIDTYVTTICCEVKFKNRFKELYATEGIAILEWEEVNSVDQIDDSVNCTIIMADK